MSNVFSSVPLGLDYRDGQRLSDVVNERAYTLCNDDKLNNVFEDGVTSSDGLNRGGGVLCIDGMMVPGSVRGGWPAEDGEMGRVPPHGCLGEQSLGK